MKAQVWVINETKTVQCQIGEGMPAKLGQIGGKTDLVPMCKLDDLVGTFEIGPPVTIWDPAEKRTWGEAAKACRGKATELGYSYYYDEHPRVVAMSS